MKTKALATTAIAGLMTLAATVVFINGAQALDLGDFTGQDREVITQEAPKRGGAVLVKEDIIYPAAAQQTRQQPMITGAQQPTQLNDYAPAAGGRASVDTEPRSFGSLPGKPGVGIDNKVDVTTMPGNAFDRVQARLGAAGTPSKPVDGKPLTTNVTADGQRINTLNDIVPAAGGDAGFVQGTQQSVVPQAQYTPRAPIKAAVDNQQSIQSMTGRAKSQAFNN